MGTATRGDRRDADVIVIGGGAMGSAAAWQLAGRGLDVLLLERFEPGHTQGASHGASRIFRLSYPDPLHIGLARRAGELWRELEGESGVALLSVTGGVDHGGSPALDRLCAGLEAEGVESHWLDAAEAEDRWPGMRVDTRALYHPDSGRLHADRAVSALQSAAGERGAVVLHRTRVQRIRVIDDGCVEVETEPDRRPLRARRVVVAAGAWTEHLLAGLVPLPRLRVTQEQPAHFVPVAGEAGWPSFVHRIAPEADGFQKFHSGIYGMATPGEGVKVGFHGVGPRVDPDRRDFRPRPELAAALEEYVRTWLPGLDASTAVPISCTYTTTPDETFVLDRRGPIVVAAGFSGHGFKFVPVIGRILADLAVDGKRPDPLFALDRPRRAPQTV
ncbi:N-methyl-L-tryptophan oxidase [Kineosporia mesophila]|uniref:N-methyl-L-tryptophan oxidase n=1 Tax=Kineosporia mesophila TaxID=566012 RepID=A0ABP6Z202_9ACTN|nr:FAD-dependent oxidoreductase [Kineosporia mesophila]